MGSDHKGLGREARLSKRPGLRSVGSAITRRLFDLGVSAVVVTLLAGVAVAQTPPSERELRIYAGLHDAAARGDVAEIEKLAAEGEKLNIQDAKSRTPLHVAAFMHKHDAARALLRLGADPNALDGGGNARAITSPYDGTALIAAAHRGHVDVVRALIAAKAPLNHVNNLGWTALLEAVVLGNGGRDHTAVVEALVKAGADVTLPDRQGTTALGHARTRGYSQIARTLENAGAR